MEKKLHRLFVTAIISALCFAISAYADVPIDEEHFPGDSFRVYVRDKLDTDKDGVLTSDEISAVKNIALGQNTRFAYSVSDMRGLEYFSALEELIIHSYEGYELKELDISKNTELISLDCSYNDLSVLDISKNTALRKLYCRNNQLTELDLSNNMDLRELSCASNLLTRLDLSFHNINDVFCSFNEYLEELDVSNASIGWLTCSGCNLATLDLTSTHISFALECRDNKLTSLDASCIGGYASLLDCSNNLLKELKVGNLAFLDCYNNQLTSLDLSDSTMLEWLDCSNNQLSTLDFATARLLWFLNCGHNNLTELDVSKNTALMGLRCDYNQLAVLDLSNNTALQTILCNTQSIYGLNLTDTGNPSYPYQFSFTDVMSPDKIANVSDVKGLDVTSTEITPSYANGIALFASKPSKVTYNYNTGYGEVKMDVTVSDTAANVKIDAENFPDDVFRGYVSENFDKDADGYLSEEEIENATYIDVMSRGISTLKGIE